MPVLRYNSRDGTPCECALHDREILIGRLSKCDIVVPRPTVSRQHARVYRSGDRWFITDLSSSHGTEVNDKKISERALKSGDRIRVGTATLVFSDDAAQDLQAQPKRDLQGFGVELDAPTAGTPHPESSLVSRDDILAEHGIADGQLMQTIAQARQLDVTGLLALPSEPLAGTRVARPRGKNKASESAPVDHSVASHLLTLVRINDELRRCTDVDSVCTTAIEMVLSATGASRGVIALRQADGSYAVRVQCAADGEDQKVEVSQTFVDRVVKKRVALVAMDTGEDQALALAKSVVAFNIRSILCAPLWSGEEILGYLYLDRIGISHPFGESDLDFSSAVGHQAASEIQRLRLLDEIQDERERRRNLGRFLSDDVIRHIENEAKAGRLDPTLSAKEQEVSILFSDIVGFTALSENMDPAQIKHLLDDYFDAMTTIIIDRYAGTLDKYMGDAIMALWGAPFSSGPQIDARNAVAAAVAMRDTLRRMQRERPVYNRIQVRIGINTGAVVAGMIGSQRRLEYSVLGDAVNVASRLESSSEPGKIQIGERCHELVRKVFDCRFAGERKVKNRNRSIAAWWVKGSRRSDADR